MAVATVAVGGLAACGVAIEPLQHAELKELVTQDRAEIEQRQEVLDAPVSLYEALARVVSYNLDNRTRMMEEALANRQADLARYDMLPTLAANAGYIGRSNKPSSVSANHQDGTRGLPDSATYSQDLERTTADTRLSWNILDFGVSYLQAHQQNNRFLITMANRDKLMLRLLQQARTAYWRAAAAQAMKPEVEAVLVEARQSLDDIDRALAERLSPPLGLLQQQRTLLEIVGQLEALERQLGAATIDLKSLMNIGPTQDVKVVVPEALPALPRLDAQLEDLELVALVNSADIAEQIYSLRIERDEGRKALLRLLPGIEFYGTANYDSNSFLMNNAWTEAGGRVTWNLFRLFSLPATRQMAAAREDLAIVRRQAMTMAVISRLHMSWWRYADMVNQLERSDQINAVEQRIAAISSAAEGADAGSTVERIRNQASALRAGLRYYESYGNAQDALGTVLVSLGLNPVPADYRLLSIDSLAAEIESRMRQWEGGDLPVLEESVSEDTPNDDVPSGDAVSDHDALERAPIGGNA